MNILNKLLLEYEISSGLVYAIGVVIEKKYSELVKGSNRLTMGVNNKKRNRIMGNTMGELWSGFNK